jgi:hypothetical protein
MYSTSPLLMYSYDLFAQTKKEKLQFAYFTACDLGLYDYKEKWTNALKPAKVILYTRESSILENILWILIKSKKEILGNN